MTHKQRNIKGIKTLKVMLETDGPNSGGPIVIFVDMNTKEVLGAVPGK
ncbi:hypothetical protein QFZ87_000690 [Bacillus sp. SLBN-46]|nr:hypothetical protein [Bacillus sp. SLBN-46]MDR6121093.1 hypothetical protein [Bacillus sp. SLBN-46]